MKSEDTQHDRFLILYCLVPAALALIGAFLYLPSWYYSLFKIVMVVDAIMAICIFSICKSSGKDGLLMVVLGVTIVISFIAFLGIVSQFFVPGGFPKALWVVLDIIYAISKAIQYAFFK